MLNGWDNASYRSRDMVSGFQRTRIHNWSNAYFQYQNGTLNEAQWIPIQRKITSASPDEAVRRVWADWSYIAEDEFRALAERRFEKR